MMINIGKHLFRRVPSESSAINRTNVTPQFSFYIIKRNASHHSAHQKKSFCTSYFVCKVREVADHLSPWFILGKVIPRCHIIKFRRELKRFSFPWLAYSLPIATAMCFGDILAQMYRIPFTTVKDESIISLKKKVAFKDVDFQRTVKFMALGFFVLGPLLSRWNIFIARKLAHNTAQQYFVKQLVLDLLIMAPVLTYIGLAVWDVNQVKRYFPNLEAIWHKRIRRPFWDILQFNLLTRPLMDLAICFLTPCCLRKFVRRPYEILFMAYVSSILANYGLGHMYVKPPPPPPPPKPRCNFRRSRR